MSSAEIKSDIHRIVDAIDDEIVLKSVHDFLQTSQQDRPSHFWNSLTEEQKNEILLAFEESEDDEQLMELKDLFARKNDGRSHKEGNT